MQLKMGDIWGTMKECVYTCVLPVFSHYYWIYVLSMMYFAKCNTCYDALHCTACTCNAFHCNRVNV